MIETVCMNQEGQIKIKFEKFVNIYVSKYKMFKKKRKVN